MNLVLVNYEARLSSESQLFNSVKTSTVTCHLTVNVSVQCTLYTLRPLPHDFKTRVKNNFQRKYAYEQI
jgi:hypothetical protein